MRYLGALQGNVWNKSPLGATHVEKFSGRVLVQCDGFATSVKLCNHSFIHCQSTLCSITLDCSTVDTGRILLHFLSSMHPLPLCRRT